MGGDYSQFGCQPHLPVASCMHSRSPVDPSLQMTPISGFAWHCVGSVHGVVLFGGTHAECHAQPCSFSFPHCAPLKTVPAGQMLASGFAPHFDSGHGANETVPSGSGSLQPQLPPPAPGEHEGFDDFDDSGTAPHAPAVHGEVKLNASRGVPRLPPVSPPGFDGLLSVGGAFVLGEDGAGSVTVVVHAAAKKRPKRAERT